MSEQRAAQKKRKPGLDLLHVTETMQQTGRPRIALLGQITFRRLSVR